MEQTAQRVPLHQFIALRGEAGLMSCPRWWGEAVRIRPWPIFPHQGRVQMITCESLSASIARQVANPSLQECMSPDSVPAALRCDTLYLRHESGLRSQGSYTNGYAGATEPLRH